MWRSENDFHHRVRGQGSVDLIQLRAAGGGDGDRDTQVFTAGAFAQLERTRGVKARVELLSDVRDGMNKTIDLGAHDLDREAAGVFNQRLFARIILGRKCGRHLANYPLAVGVCLDVYGFSRTIAGFAGSHGCNLDVNKHDQNTA